MRRWFLSYNSQDLPLTRAFEAALREQDGAAHIFFAPRNLRAGGYWLPELAREIADATIFVLLVGEKGLGPWQVPEYYEAIDRRVKEPDFPIVLLLLDGQPAPGLPFLRQLHWIVTPEPASAASLGRVMDAATTGDDARPGELWRHVAPYRGLAAMDEKDSDYFFGRERETLEILTALAETPDKLAILLGNSGVGKSSLAQAGVLAALKRQAWPEGATASAPWPQAFNESRRWCFLTMRPGTGPVRALVEVFLETWQIDRTSTEWPLRRSEWCEALLKGTLTLGDLIDQTSRRHAELQHPEPVAYLLYVDQGEELYVRASHEERLCFSNLVAEALEKRRLLCIMSLRADFFGSLQNDESLYRVHRQISVAPLRENQILAVVSRPAELLAARFETERIAETIARRTAEDSTRDAGALPLLSYLLDDMWTQMVQRGDGVLRLPEQAFELGGVLVGRAEAFIASHPGSIDKLRSIFTLKLATVREDGEPTRRQAWRQEFSDEEWRLVSDLADHPYRLLITAAQDKSAQAGDAAPDASHQAETYAEVAHEAIFRRWTRLREWIAGEREFLAWRSQLETAQRTWTATPEKLRPAALLMGLSLAQAQKWMAKRADDIAPADRDFIRLSQKTAGRQRLKGRIAFGALSVAILIGLVGWMNERAIHDTWRWMMVVRPYIVSDVRPHVLTDQAESALTPGDSFRECTTDCPEMVVLPVGAFLMGSPPEEAGRNGNEGPQHRVAGIGPIAVSRHEVTFADWDACVTYGDCRANVSDHGWGRDSQPVIDVTWEDARRYAAWLSTMTGKTYRLLSESEWEYAARAGSRTAYSWGDDIGTGRANCNGCGSQWDAVKPAPVGSFAPNAFGLSDMHGNVWEWVEDCYHATYEGAPDKGIAWRDGGECDRPVIRGGSSNATPGNIRSALRGRGPTGGKASDLGFRIARVLAPAVDPRDQR